MKKKNLILLFLVPLALIIGGCSTGQVVQNNGEDNSNYNSPDNNSAYDEYNVDDLNQYGEWIDLSQYGRVWRPSVINSWQPFTNGNWAYDGNEWVWVSYEPFGWIVYHYGSWDYDPPYGWIWIPGTDQWSPARVQWEDYGDNIGWAPIRYNHRNWSEPWENNNINPWMVVKMQDFNRENISSYRENNISRIRNINQVQIERRPPDVKVVQRYVKEPIPIVRIVREPVRNQAPPVRITNPPVRTETPPVRNDNPPVRTNTPPVKTETPPVRNDNPPVRTNTPPVRNDNPPVKTNTPPVNRNTQNDRNIIHMQVPPGEKQKVDRYRPKVEREALIKRNPPVIKPAPKNDGKNNTDKKTREENNKSR